MPDDEDGDGDRDGDQDARPHLDIRHKMAYERLAAVPVSVYEKNEFFARELLPVRKAHETLVLRGENRISAMWIAWALVNAV